MKKGINFTLSTTFPCLQPKTEFIPILRIKHIIGPSPIPLNNKHPHNFNLFELVDI